MVISRRIAHMRITMVLYWILSEHSSSGELRMYYNQDRKYSTAVKC